MSKQTVYLLGILITIILGTYLSYLYCCDHEPADAMVTTMPDVDPTRYAFAVDDPNGNLDVRVNDNFNFDMSSSPYLRPLSTSLTEASQEVSDYFQGHENKIMTITGYYSSDEENNTAYPNLGLARANAVKNYFVSLGFPSRHIDTRGELKDGLVPDADNILYGPVDFAVSQLDDRTALMEEMAAIAAEIKDDPLLLYFETDQATLTLTPEQREKVAKISRYLDKVGESRCHIVGHADNTGTEEHNYNLGMERARFAEEYFLDNHIPESHMEIISKGEKEPIADNDTEEGRAKNRRVIVTLN